jgi:signal peptidase I
MAQNPFFEEKKQKRNYFALVVTVLAIIITVMAFIYFFVLTPNEVKGPSMLPNFEDGQVLLVSRPYTWLWDTGIGNTLGIKYQRGDVVIFKHPSEGDIVKRIIALPGETIRLSNGVFYINGQLASEQFQIINNQRLGGEVLVNNGPGITLGDDEFFLAGDNRDVSLDSRSLGPINIRDIKGKVISIIYPFDELGSVKRGVITLNSL